MSWSLAVFVFWNRLYFLLQQVRGGFLHEGESSIPLGIMSFKTITSSSSPACLSSFVIASSPDHAGHVTDKDAEEKEVTVHLMKEEACKLLFLCFVSSISQLLLAIALKQDAGRWWFMIVLSPSGYPWTDSCSLPAVNRYSPVAPVSTRSCISSHDASHHGMFPAFGNSRWILEEEGATRKSQYFWRRFPLSWTRSGFMVSLRSLELHEVKEEF